MSDIHDSVNNPKHYNNSPAHCECGRRIECIDVTRHMGFNIGNAVKYLWRFQDKNGIQDLRKAAWYLNDTIKQMSGHDKCYDCGNTLNEYELKAKEDENSEEWCCYECNPN